MAKSIHFSKNVANGGALTAVALIPLGLRSSSETITDVRAELRFGCDTRELIWYRGDPLDFEEGERSTTRFALLGYEDMRGVRVERTEV